MRIEKNQMEVLKQIPVVLHWNKRHKIEVDGKKEWVYDETYYNCSTGEESFELSDVVDLDSEYSLLKRESKTIDGYAVQWEEGLQMFAVIYALFNTRTIRDGEKRLWEEQSRFYFNLDKTIYAKKYGWEYNHDICRWVRTPDTPEYFEYVCDGKINFPFDLYKWVDINRMEKGGSKSFDELAKKIPRVVTLAGNRMRVLDNGDALACYLKYKETKKKTGPKQAKIDELTAIALPDVEYTKEIDKAENKYDTSINVCFIQKVPKKDEALCVLRTFKVVRETKEMIEGARCYISKKEVICCKKDNSGNYINAALHNDATNWLFNLEQIEEDAAKGTALEYCLSIIKEFDLSDQGMAIMAFTKWPIFEMLYKSGYKDFVKKVVEKGRYTSPKKELETVLGKISTGKNPNKILGLNKKQLEIVLKDIYNEKYGYWHTRPIIFMKDILSENTTQHSWWYNYNSKNKTFISLCDMDDATFTKLYDFCDKLADDQTKRERKIKVGANIIVNTCVIISQMYGLKVLVSMLDDIYMLALCSTQYGYGRHDTNYIRVLRDYLDMVKQMQLTNRLKPYFETKEDVIAMHDDLVVAFNCKKSEIELAKWKGRYEVWKKFVYSDENYSVIYPESPEDIANEGLVLHHCVKGYTSRVVNGTTNIMFIRKAQELDKPFFTVEISNNETIEQIHGFANCNLNSEPDLEYFVADWVKANKLKTNRFDKVR